MKGAPLDYLLSAFALTLVGALSLGVAAGASVLVSRPLAGPYSVLADLLVFLLVFGILCAVAARLVLRGWPLGVGLIPMDDPRFTVWKLYTVLYEFGCGALKPFTVMFLRPLVQQLFGASVGKDIALGGKLVDPHLIRIEDGAIIGEGSVVTAHAINSGSIFLAPVIVGRRATVGVGAVVYPGVVVGEGAVITANAVVRSGTQIPAGEVWGGVPAKRLRGSDEAEA
jgi:serine acetyltransferase